MTFHSLTDTYKLNNGVDIPIIGFGTWQTPNGAIAENAVLTALNNGYRHIDTAAAYGNEASVGRAIKKSGIDRHAIFVTTKLNNPDHGNRATQQAIDKSLQELGLDYIDLYLIHWPNPVMARDNWAELNAQSWRAMEEAVEAGKIRAIGVSNFRKHHLQELFKTAEIMPAINQNYLNPSDLQPDVTQYCDDLGIFNEAYSPLGTGGLLSNPMVTGVAKNHDKTPAQVLIRWSLQHGFIPLPKSVHGDYIVANTKVFDFNLTDEEMKNLDELHGSTGVATDPDKTDF